MNVKTAMEDSTQFPKAPPLLFELTEEQAADLDKAKPPGAVTLTDRHLLFQPFRTRPTGSPGIEGVRRCSA